jgi:hypothetical protein
MVLLEWGRLNASQVCIFTGAEVGDDSWHYSWFVLGLHLEGCCDLVAWVATRLTQQCLLMNEVNVRCQVTIGCVVVCDCKLDLISLNFLFTLLDASLYFLRFGFNFSCHLPTIVLDPSFKNLILLRHLFHLFLYTLQILLKAVVFFLQFTYLHLGHF